MPQSLHAELARVAEHEGVSLNTLITGRPGQLRGLARRLGRGLAVVDAGAEDDRPAPQRPRWTSIALAANLVVVVSPPPWPSCCWSSPSATAGSPDHMLCAC
jgi:hypothetical protein